MSWPRRSAPSPCLVPSGSSVQEVSCPSHAKPCGLDRGSGALDCPACRPSASGVGILRSVSIPSTVGGRLIVKQHTRGGAGPDENHAAGTDASATEGAQPPAGGCRRCCRLRLILPRSFLARPTIRQHDGAVVTGPVALSGSVNSPFHRRATIWHGVLSGHAIGLRRAHHATTDSCK